MSHSDIPQAYGSPFNGSTPLPAANSKHAPSLSLNGHVLEAPSERTQIIDDDKNFTSVGLIFPVCDLTHPNSPHLSAQIERWGLRDAGFNYNIVAVFGSQSTGKSMLYIHLAAPLLSQPCTPKALF